MQEHALGGYLGPRTFVVWRSPRLDRWPVEYTRAFYKPMRSSSPERAEWDREEVHLGAAVTPMGGVCLGIYGQWHHPIGGKVSQKEIEKTRKVEGGYQTHGTSEKTAKEARRKKKERKPHLLLSFPGFLVSLEALPWNTPQHIPWRTFPFPSRSARSTGAAAPDRPPNVSLSSRRTRRAACGHS